MAGGTIAIEFRLNPINSWFIKGLADPFVMVDGEERKATWSNGAEIHVPSGEHHVAAFFRYRGTSSALGSATVDVRVDDGGARRITAKNGLMNQTPFRLAVA